MSMPGHLLHVICLASLRPLLAIIQSNGSYASILAKDVLDACALSAGSHGDSLAAMPAAVKHLRLGLSREFPSAVP